MQHVQRRTVAFLLGTPTTTLTTAVRDNPLRFVEIRRRIQGVSDRMLTQTLRAMERDGLVQRKVYDERLPRVEYALSSLARSALPIVVELKKWAECSLESIEASMQRFDSNIDPRVAFHQT
ncbi:transcriptional regulator [Paraburkholderia sp. 5N]|uniref:Transcriptional regulator n=1 Tax=Paraburkholderia elongata TaxID=2675747 RepID=A0A972NY55_9BURK|nr:transcriptional regulator [Paraburkholderia elongata]